MGYLIDILIGAVSRIVTGELSAHVEPMARWIISKAVERLPADDRDRFREEWLAHLEEVPGAIRKLWHALGCYFGAIKVGDVFAEEQTQLQHLDAETLWRYAQADPEIMILIEEAMSIVRSHGGPASLVKSEYAQFDRFFQELLPIARKLRPKVLGKMRSERGNTPPPNQR